MNRKQGSQAVEKIRDSINFGFNFLCFMLAILIGGYIILWCVNSWQSVACGQTQDAYANGYWKGYSEGWASGKEAGGRDLVVRYWQGWTDGIDLGINMTRCPGPSTITQAYHVWSIWACDSLKMNYDIKDVLTNKTLCEIRFQRYISSDGEPVSREVEE